MTPARRTLWLKVWCDGSADPSRRRIAWACVSSGIEAHGQGADGIDPMVAFGVTRAVATSMVAEACAVAAGLKLGRRIAAALEASPSNPEVRLHVVSDCETLVNGIRERSRPRGMPDSLWDYLAAERRAGAVFSHAPRVSSPELAFVDRLAHTALSRAEKVSAVAKQSAVASTLVRSLGVEAEEAERLEAAISHLRSAVSGKVLVPADFALRVAFDPGGRIRIAETRGGLPTVDGENAMGRVKAALISLRGAGVEFEEGVWMRPTPGRRLLFSPVAAAAPAPAPR